MSRIGAGARGIARTEVVYRQGADGALQADGVVVLAATASGVSRVVKFHDPALAAAFGCPGVLAH